jgi:hypothetical protein
LNCPLGWSSEKGSSKCLACDAGKFQTTQMNVPICENCPINTYTNQKAQIICKDCDDAANSVEGSSVCIKCVVGQYMTGSPRSCLDCAPGRYSNYGEVVCTDCDQGQYAVKLIESKLLKCTKGCTGCKSCPAGQYGSDVAKSAVELRIDTDGACDECGIGKYSVAEGAKLETSCIDCQPGKKAKNDQVARTEETNACTNCLVGQYRPSQIEVNGVMTDTELTECK